MARLDFVADESEMYDPKLIAVAKTLFEGIQNLYGEINTIRTGLGFPALPVPTRDDFINRVKHHLRS